MMSSRTAELAEQFEDIAQQRQAATLGMWVFLATEVMFFGALFLAFSVNRSLHVESFRQAAKHLDILAGTINTAVLFTSSFTTALAVAALQQGKLKRVVGLLSVSIVLGGLFLAIKGYEYHEKWTEGLFPGAAFAVNDPAGKEVELFFLFYFILTGLHGIHLLIALAVTAVLVWLVAMGRVTPARPTPLEASALYWHFVDVVWVFVFPLLYLIGGR
jgi:cytochrome c oxidase subunit 3